MPRDQEFPTLAAMTDAVAARMHEAEAIGRSGTRASTRRLARRHRRQRGAAVVLGALALGVPAAVALNAVLAPTEVQYGAAVAGPGGLERLEGSAFIVSHGVTRAGGRDVPWYVSLRRCVAGGSSGVGTLGVIGVRGAVPDGCPAPDATRPGALENPAPTLRRSRGISLVYGVTPATVTSVRVVTRRYAGARTGARVPVGAPGPVIVPTSALPDDAVAAGHLPPDFRVFHLEPTEADLGLVSAAMLNRAGEAVLICTPARCRRP